MKNTTFIVALAVTWICSARAASPDMGGLCSGVPALHHSIEAEMADCTAMIHNFHGSSGIGSSGQLPELRAAGYYQRGLLYHLQGRLELAIADYTSAIGWRRDFSDAYEARGDALEDLAETAKATADYATASRLGSDDADQLDDRCWVRAVRGHPLDRALADCSKALKREPDQKEFLDSRCFVYYKMGNYSAAVTDCEAAEKQQRRFASSLFIGGLAKLRLGDETGGNEDIDAALNADYRIADLYALYGVRR